MTKNSFYITTAIDYPNADPHIGHAYEKIVADCYARWNRLRGRDVFFLTGLDEHGQKIQQAAENANYAPQDFVDKQAIKFKDFCKKLDISYDDFIRTTQKRHEVVAQAIFKKVYDKGDIYLGEYEGHYCVPCETFWTDAQLVEGNCPNCRRPTTLLKEPSYFFKMGKYKKQVVDYINKSPNFILPLTRRNEILSRLKEELRDLSVSRCSLEWGIPTTIDPGHVIYVWFDALINYVSALGYPDGKFKRFWPANIHVIGKDILWFHTVIWPCMLFAAGTKPPKCVYVHGFINDERGEKMSKSKGNIVEPLEMIGKYSSDVLRYYFLRSIPSGDDGNFSEKELVARYNNELANDLGNLLMRVAKLVLKYFGGRLHNEGYEQELEWQQAFNEADKLMDELEHNKALDRIWTLVNKANSYMNEKEPWKIKDEKELAKVLYNVLETVRIINCCLSPFMPVTAEKVCEQLGMELGDFEKLHFGFGRYYIKEAKPLFPKIELGGEKLERVPEEKKPEPFSALELKVAKVLGVKPHPEAEKLLILKIDLAAEQRQLVAGLKDYYKPQELVGKQIVVLTNLKPVKLRGVDSQGMLLAAEEDKKNVKVLEAPNSSPGDKVFVEGIKPEPEKQLELKDFMKVKMKVKAGKIDYGGKFLRTDKEEVIVKGVKEGAPVR